jgi:hypothetical protein
MAIKTGAATEYDLKGGHPTADTIRKASDKADFQRAVTKANGSRRFRARDDSSTSAYTALNNRPSTEVGNQEISRGRHESSVCGSVWGRLCVCPYADSQTAIGRGKE